MTRPLWMAAGLCCFGLGWLGLILPMMPGFVFLLASLFCFARGNPAWEARLLDHPTYGPPLRDWRESRSVSRKAKRTALTTMAVAGVLCGWLIGFPMALLSIVPMAGVAIWLWNRPEGPVADQAAD